MELLCGVLFRVMFHYPRSHERFHVLGYRSEVSGSLIVVVFLAVAGGLVDDSHFLEAGYTLKSMLNLSISSSVYWELMNNGYLPKLVVHFSCVSNIVFAGNRKTFGE